MSPKECCVCGRREQQSARVTIQNGPITSEFILCPLCADRVRGYIKSLILSNPRDFRFPTPESEGGCRTFRLVFDPDHLSKGANGHPVAHPRIKGTWIRLAHQQDWLLEAHTIVVKLDHPIHPEMVIFDLENNVYRELPHTEPVPSEGVSS